MEIKVEKYTLVTEVNGLSLGFTINKYTRSASKVGIPEGRVVLVLGHGAGFSKEHWEPVLEDLFEFDAGDTAGYIVREAWSLDAPNHGEAAILNDRTLAQNPSVADIWNYAGAYATFFKSSLLDGLDPTFHRVVLCGHSAGSVAASLSTGFFNPPSQLPFSEAIFIDPPMWSRFMGGKEFTSEMYKAAKASTPTRRDMWDSKEAAATWMKRRLPWSRWDDRIFNIFIKKGLRALPTAHYPDHQMGVTLATHRSEENHMSFPGQIYSLDATDRLNQICRYRPVHLIYGGRCDMFARDVQDSLISQQEGRIFASVTRLSKTVGHLVVQEAPSELAKSMFDILVKERGSEFAFSRL